MFCICLLCTFIKVLFKPSLSLLILCVDNKSIIDSGASDCAPQLGKVTVLACQSVGAVSYAPWLGRVIGCTPCLGKATGWPAIGQGHMLGSATGWGCRLSSSVGWYHRLFSRILRVTVKAPWLCRARAMLNSWVGCVPQLLGYWFLWPCFPEWWDWMLGSAGWWDCEFVPLPAWAIKCTPL